MGEVRNLPGWLLVAHKSNLRRTKIRSQARPSLSCKKDELANNWDAEMRDSISRRQILRIDGQFHIGKAVGHVV